MRRVAELYAVVLQASKEIQNGIAQAGQAYQELLPAIHEFAERAYRNGGAGSVDDLMVHAGPERIRTDIIGLMIAAGFKEVIVTSQGRPDFAPVPDFAGRMQELINAGHLVASRGRDTPNPDPLSWARHAGIRIHKEPSQ